MLEAMHRDLPLEPSFSPIVSVAGGAARLPDPARAICMSRWCCIAPHSGSGKKPPTLGSFASTRQQTCRPRLAA